jgi:hypothetical protein
VTGSASPSVCSHRHSTSGRPPAAVPQGTHHHADLDEVLEVATGSDPRAAEALGELPGRPHAGRLPQLGDRLVQPLGARPFGRPAAPPSGRYMSSRTRSTAGPSHSDLCRSLTFTSYATSARHVNGKCDIRNENRQQAAGGRVSSCRDAAKIDRTRRATLTRLRCVANAGQSTLHAPHSRGDEKPNP